MYKFSTFIPIFGNSNPNIRYFAHLENGKKKELKHESGNIYYFFVNRKRVYVSVNGCLYHKEFSVFA